MEEAANGELPIGHQLDPRLSARRLFVQLEWTLKQQQQRRMCTLAAAILSSRLSCHCRPLAVRVWPWSLSFAVRSRGPNAAQTGSIQHAGLNAAS